MGAYFDELKRSMEMLAQDDRVLFLGQAVACPGTAMTNTLAGVARDKLLELPVDELEAVLGRRAEVVAAVHGAGYRYVTLDLEGFRSGNLNAALG